jgi:hypothetical protein
MPETSTTPLDPSTALEVLDQLRDQLGEVDPQVRAIVALRMTGPKHVELVDVDLHGNRVLDPPADAAGLVVVTGEEVVGSDEASDGSQAAGGTGSGSVADGDPELDDPVCLQQFVCVLPDGDEVGIATVADEDEPRRWTTADDPEGDAASLRPRDLASNTARRAFGLPSLVTLPPITDVLARAWLLGVATEAMARFDGPSGLHEVTPEDLDEALPEGLLAEAGPVPTWEDLHAAAIAGELDLGRFTVDGDHARWLDAAGFGQLLDVTLPPTEELLETLQVVGDDDLLGWAIGELAARGWST